MIIDMSVIILNTFIKIFARIISQIEEIGESLEKSIHSFTNDVRIVPKRMITNFVILIIEIRSQSTESIYRDEVYFCSRFTPLNTSLVCNSISYFWTSYEFSIDFRLNLEPFKMYSFKKRFDASRPSQNYTTLKFTWKIEKTLTVDDKLLELRTHRKYFDVNKKFTSRSMQFFTHLYTYSNDVIF